MTDEELIARLRGPMPHILFIKGAASILAAVARERKDAADRIEALVKERDEHRRNWNQAFNTNAALLERAERLEAALRFYADPAGDGYEVRDRSMGDQRADGHIIMDRGDIARAALTQKAAHVNETPKPEHDAGNVLTPAPDAPTPQQVVDAMKDAAAIATKAYREGWAFAYRQWEATGSVPQPTEKPHDRA